MSSSVSSIEDADFIFENTLVRVVALRNSPKINLIGMEVGPFEEGNEYSLMFWIAKELEKAGVVRFPEEERLDVSRLYKIQWTERIQPVSQISSLPEAFYPRLRHMLAELKRSSKNNLEKMKRYETMRRLSQDIVSCRLKKIISLASASGGVEQILKNLTVEERKLHKELRRIISDWRSKIL
ncbi:MAG: hypothetical protein ACE5NN_01380 [Candidatus Bathyarchaeia archaeon]